MGDVRVSPLMWWFLLLPALAVIAGAGFVCWVAHGIRLVASGALEMDEGEDDD